MKVAMSAMRVVEQTHPHVNQRIERQTEIRVNYHANHPERIDERLRQLDAEWDIERMLEANSAALTLLGLVMAIRNRGWLLLSIAVQSFFMQHALQGWCPPLPVLRRLGFRTEAEIQAEKYALKALRGDFAESQDPHEVSKSVRH